MKWSFCWLLAVVYLSALSRNGLALVINGTQGSFIPDGLTSFSIQWNVTGPNTININVTADYAEFSGGGGFHDFWVAVGFSENTNDAEPFMFPADVIISSPTHASQGLIPPVEDRHNIAQSAPLMDTTSNINNRVIILDGTVFTMIFTRSLVTSDESDEDVSLNVPRYWIWAVGNYTNGTFTRHSFTGRGVSDSPIDPCFSFNCTGSSDGESSELPLATSCEPEITISERFGQYDWPETDPNNACALPCEYGAAFSDIEVYSADATRRCNSSGEWDPPNFTLCRSAFPEVTLSPSNKVIIVEIGRRVHISCTVTSFNSSDHENSGWFKINDDAMTEVDSLSTFNDNNFMVDSNDLYSLRPNVTVQALGSVLFQQMNDSDLDQMDLISWMYDIDENTYTIQTTEGIEGMYMCRGINSFGMMDAIVTIEVEAPDSAQASSSRSFIRLSMAGQFSNSFPFISNKLQLAVIESSLLEMVSADRNGIQVLNCSNITSMQTMFQERLECLIREFPPQESTTALGSEVLQQFQLTYPSTRKTNSSETGFCDAESTKDQTYGSYMWPELAGGQTVSIMCKVSGSNGYARRNCLGSKEGWNNIIDYTECRNVVTLSNPFEYYLRFASTSMDMPSSNMSSNMSSNDLILNNIRITIELSSNSISAAHCTFVPKLPETIEDRVECRVNGTSESESYSGIQSTVIDRLIARGLLLRGSNTSNEEGFCDSETTNGPEGTVEWPESQVDVSRSLVCPFGPNDRRVSRLCISRSNWTTPNASECATNVTQGLQTLNEALKEFNTTNVAEFTNDLTDLVSNSLVSVTDQTTENSQIVLDVLIVTSVLVQSPNVNLQDSLMITSDIVVILDNVEEWPQESTQNQGPAIIEAFESVTTSLVQKDNFTELIVAKDDIALVAEKVSVNSIKQEGRTFVVNQMNGALDVNRGSQTNQSLQENQPAILTFPSGIDLQELLMNNNGADDVGIFFVVYEEDNLFPVRTDQQEPIDPVGSAVVSFTIAGLPSGTILPQPISINLRIVNPNTGSSENIHNATCVFYNFTSLSWDPTGCETIFDPDVNPDEVTCRCSHLTNFASLVDISSRSTEDDILTHAQRVSLSVVTYIGVALSLVGLLLTIVTLLIFKKIRGRDVTKFHLQLCISLACMYIVFVSGIDSTDNRGGCITVGVMIHYFTLVAWMWMGAEALLMFQKLIIIFGTITWKYILFISVLCWSIPVVPVLISVSVDPDHYITIYNDNTFCFISHIGVFFGAFLGPIFLVIIFNTVIYALVIRVIVKRNMEKNKVVSGKYSMTGLEVFKLLLSVCGIMFLFGLSWVFAVFTFIRDATYAFQLLFAIFNAFQGFWIFFFFILLNSETRDAWKNLIKCCSTAKASTTLTSSSSKPGNARGAPLLASNTTSSTAAAPTSFVTDSVAPDNDQDHNESVSGNGTVSGDNFIRVDSVDIVEELEREADKEPLPEIPLKPLGVRFKDEDHDEEQKESWEGDENIMRRMLRRLTQLKKHEVQEVKIDFNE